MLRVLIKSFPKPRIQRTTSATTATTIAFNRKGCKRFIHSSTTLLNNTYNNKNNYDNHIISFPTISSSSTNIHNHNHNDNIQIRNSNEQRKYELLQYIKKAIRYNIEQILDINDNKHSRSSRSRSSHHHHQQQQQQQPFLRSKMEKRLYYERNEMMRHKQQSSYNNSNYDLNTIAVVEEKISNNDNNDNNDNNNDDDTIMEIKSLSPSSSMSSSSSLLSLLEDNQNIHDQKAQQAGNIQSILQHNNNNNNNNESNTLFELLDDDDYGFDDEEDDDNEYREDINDRSHSTKETSLLSLLNNDDDEDFISKNSISSSSPSTTTRQSESLLDLLAYDDSNGNSSDTKLSSQSQSPSSPLSLLDLLDEDSIHNNKYDETSESKKRMEKDVPKEASSSLLDFLNSTEGNNDNMGRYLDVNNDKEVFDTSKKSSSSLLDLLDDINHDTLVKEETRKHTAESNNSQSLLSLIDLGNHDDIVDQNLGDNNDNQEINDDDDVTDESDLLMRSKSLLSVMHKKHWKLYRQSQKLDDVDIDSFDSDVLLMTSDIVEEEVMDEALDDEALDDDLFQIDEKNTDVASENEELKILISSLINELMLGARSNKWQLTSHELNLLLTFVGISNMDDKAEILLKIYLLMDEFRRSGVIDAAPNADTYTILMTLLDQSENATAVAAELGLRMMKHGDLRHRDVHEDHKIEDLESDHFHLDENLLHIAMKVFTKRFDQTNAEILINWAKENSDLNISPYTYKSLFRLYRSDNQQEKALKLIRECMEVR